MKQVLLFLFLCALSPSLVAQVDRPPLSPLQKIEQGIGFTEVEIIYSRPSRKGRTIFGKLVPYQKMWRTGANQNTRITFSQDVEIKGKHLAAGTYAIFTLPQIDSWEVFFYTETEDWGIPASFSEEKVALKFQTPVIALDHPVETLTINIEDLKESSANISIRWENTAIQIPVEFHFAKVMEALALKEFDRNAYDFHIAAVNYHERNLNLAQAKKWMEIAIDIRVQPHYLDYREYAVILAKMGDMEEAIKALDTSSKLAMLLDTDRAQTAIRLNKLSLKEWTKTK